MKRNKQSQHKQSKSAILAFPLPVSPLRTRPENKKEESPKRGIFQKRLANIPKLKLFSERSPSPLKSSSDVDNNIKVLSDSFQGFKKEIERINKNQKEIKNLILSNQKTMEKANEAVRLINDERAMILEQYNFLNNDYQNMLQSKLEQKTKISSMLSTIQVLQNQVRKYFTHKTEKQNN